MRYKKPLFKTIKPIKDMKYIYHALTSRFKVSLLLLLCLVGYAARLQAQVQHSPAFSPRTSSQAPAPYTNVQNYTLQGDFTMIGNTNLTQSPYDVDGNNSDNMVYVDIDNDGSTINSSMATLQLPTGVDPSCTEIVFAGLYWTGRPGNVGNSFSRTKTVRGALTSIDRQGITLTNGGRLIGNDSHHPDYYV